MVPDTLLGHIFGVNFASKFMPYSRLSELHVPEFLSVADNGVVFCYCKQFRCLL